MYTLDATQKINDEYFFKAGPVMHLPDLKEALVHAVSLGASDITIQPDLPLIAEIYGQNYPLTRRTLSDHEVQQLLASIYGTNAIAQLSSGEDVDKLFQYSPERGKNFRFRMNGTSIALPGGDGLQMTLRSIPSIPKSLDELGIEQSIRNALAPKQGLVLIVGATGSGKSTLLAAQIRELLGNADPHKILTYESPIEFVYFDVPWRNATIAQTEIPLKLPSFERGVRNALRRKPSVILVGEARDKETVRAAVEASMTGHLVYTTVHANGVPEAIKRLVNVFEPGERHAMAFDIIDNMRLIVAQRLEPSLDGKRVALREWLEFSQSFREQLMDMTTEGAISAVRSEVSARKQTMMDSADRALAAGHLDHASHRKIAVGLTGAIERDREEALSAETQV
jgi:defect-in-organelle-trafficking protein DotB